MFETGRFKSSPQVVRSMSVAYKCTKCPGTVYMIRSPNKLKEPAKCNNCGTMNTQYKIKHGYLVLLKYRIAQLWQKSLSVFAQSADNNSGAK